MRGAHSSQAARLEALEGVEDVMAPAFARVTPPAVVPDATETKAPQPPVVVEEETQPIPRYIMKGAPQGAPQVAPQGTWPKPPERPPGTNSNKPGSSPGQQRPNPYADRE